MRNVKTLLLYSFWFQIVVLGASNIIIDFDESSVEDVEVGLGVDLSIPMNQVTYCIQIYVKRYHHTVGFHEPKYFSVAFDMYDDGIYIHQWNYGQYYGTQVQNDGIGTSYIIKIHSWTTFCSRITIDSIQVIAKRQKVFNLLLQNHQ